MIVIVSKYLIPKGYTAMALYPFVLVRNSAMTKNGVLLNHERIHLKQQAELLVLPFYIWYVLEFFIKLLKYKNKQEAYRNISFEREAYVQEANHAYLQSRPFWQFIKYNY